MKTYITWEEIFEALSFVDIPENVVYGVPKGGMLCTAFLKHASVTHNPEEATVILDDLIDSGATEEWYDQKYPLIPFTCLIDKKREKRTDWIVFPWEADHPGESGDSIEQNLVRVMQYIGEDVNREGLLETPKRIVKSYSHLFSGYEKNPADVMKVFDSETYDQIVLLKDIELYSMCEHHMLPFIGKAHIAYIPDGKVLGISKLARLLEIFTRRLQIQERIGEQVTTALMEHLSPKGAACIIEAQHLCMQMRGIEKQHSVMTTSSLKGVFLTKLDARNELMGLIK